MNKLAFFLSFIFLTNCTPTSQKKNLAIPTETNEIRKVSALVDDIKISPLFGELEELPYEIDKISLTEDLILIGDFNFSQFLYAFDRNSGESIAIPIQKGEGPNEVKEVDDFWVEDNLIYILDGIGRKIIPMTYNAGKFNLEEPIRLEVLTQRFAKTKTGFVALTGGGQENELIFLDERGKIISNHLPHSISYLMKPLNPFHYLPSSGKVLFHSSFEPVFYFVEEGDLTAYDTLTFEGERVQSPKNTDFVMDLEGFNQFRASLRNQPSMFSVFESTSSQSILLYFYQDNSYFALFSEDQASSFKSDNLKNDITFDYEIGLPLPKGASDTKFLMSIIKEQVNQSDPNFEGSELQKAILANPNAEVFVLEISLELD